MRDRLAGMTDSEWNYLRSHYPNQKLLWVFQPGEAFGEIALTRKEPRTATIITWEDTDCMVLSKDGFDKIVGAYYEFID
jgi:CRP-like cAMP-binding protein